LALQEYLQSKQLFGATNLQVRLNLRYAVAGAMKGQAMKRIILAAAFLALLGSVGWSADFQKGKAAYESGDCATAQARPRFSRLLFAKLTVPVSK